MAIMHMFVQAHGINQLFVVTSYVQPQCNDKYTSGVLDF